MRLLAEVAVQGAIAARQLLSPACSSSGAAAAVGMQHMLQGARAYASGPLTDGKPKKVLAVLYKAGEAGKRQPRLLGCVENELGLRQWLESQGHSFVVTDDKGPGGVADQHLPDADIVISTPFHPYYLNADRIAKAKNLKLSVTAGIGSDHIDLHAAAAKDITVAEVTGSNVVSVAEHVVMMILALVRNYMVGYNQIVHDQWDVAAIAADAYDLENKVVGTVGAGRIGQRVLERLVPFNCKELLYYDYGRLPADVEAKTGAKYTDLEDLVARCDIVTINCPLHDSTRGLFNKKLLSKMKKGAYLVNTARGAIVERDDLVEAVKSGHLAGYAGDVWEPQPAPANHPWRHMPRHAMTPHYSGTTLDAQARYAAGTKEIIRRSLAGEALIPTDVIVQGGKMAGQYMDAAQNKNVNLEFKETWEKVK